MYSHSMTYIMIYTDIEQYNVLNDTTSNTIQQNTITKRRIQPYIIYSLTERRTQPCRFIPNQYEKQNIQSYTNKTITQQHREHWSNTVNKTKALSLMRNRSTVLTSHSYMSRALCTRLQMTVEWWAHNRWLAPHSIILESCLLTWRLVCSNYQRLVLQLLHLAQRISGVDALNLFKGPADGESYIDNLSLRKWSQCLFVVQQNRWKWVGCE